MWFKIKSFFCFLLKSTNQHGVHSPFVYNLVTNCFYSKVNSTNYSLFKKIRQKLTKNHQVIEVTEFGAGSKVFKNNYRKISKVAKVAGSSPKKAKLLIKLSSYFKPENILEIGTSIGLGTSALHIGNPKAIIYTLEGCTKTATVAKSIFDFYNFKNIKIKTGHFNETLPNVLQNTFFDFIFFDGNHNATATLNYFEQCLKSINNNSVVIFDDIYWSKDMQKAWEQIKLHPKVTVTIDTFYFGIVFFRAEQAKQHFTIRV